MLCEKFTQKTVGSSTVEVGLSVNAVVFCGGDVFWASPGGVEWVAFRPSEMTDPRIDEIKKLLPQGMLPDWVRLGSRLVRLIRDRLHPDKHDPLMDRLLAQAQASVQTRLDRLARVPKVQ